MDFKSILLSSPLCEEQTPDPHSSIVKSNEHHHIEESDHDYTTMDEHTVVKKKDSYEYCMSLVRTNLRKQRKKNHKSLKHYYHKKSSNDHQRLTDLQRINIKDWLIDRSVEIQEFTSDLRRRFSNKGIANRFTEYNLNTIFYHDWKKHFLS